MLHRNSWLIPSLVILLLSVVSGPVFAQQTEPEIFVLSTKGTHFCGDFAVEKWKVGELEPVFLWILERQESILQLLISDDLTLESGHDLLLFGRTYDTEATKGVFTASASSNVPSLNAEERPEFLPDDLGYFTVRGNWWFDDQGRLTRIKGQFIDYGEDCYSLVKFDSDELVLVE